MGWARLSTAKWSAAEKQSRQEQAVTFIKAFSSLIKILMQNKLSKYCLPVLTAKWFLNINSTPCLGTGSDVISMSLCGPPHSPVFDFIAK